MASRLDAAMNLDHCLTVTMFRLRKRPLTMLLKE
ncbi:hypothetical protein GBAR_LOCUS20508 [Geodia barretti]|uniref:Uncharacterized protein n=1 Tax=Geodia barretti TaxID=519541 RepID=A0AA35SWH1_GEOBA|nr:hypothetical protein GBAR_LOCUS20508 [Geodia barretti]